MTFQQFKQGLQRVSLEEHNLEIASLKKSWLQTKKKKEVLKSKRQNSRNESLLSSLSILLSQDRAVIKALLQKPKLDIYREYLIHLGLDTNYISKITHPQPFQIRDKESRVHRPSKKDPYKAYLKRSKAEAPSKRYILEVVSKARHDGMLGKKLLETPNKSKKIDSTKVPLPPSYKELSEKKKVIEERKKMGKIKKKDNELKKKIMEEQERIKREQEVGTSLSLGERKTETTSCCHPPGIG